MTARLVWPDKTAEINDNGVWSCSDPEVAALLNRLYSQEQYPSSPADGVFPAAAALLAAADVFRAEIVWPSIPESTEPLDRVY